jgi:mono/diheme cytochrome c family protein
MRPRENYTPFVVIGFALTVAILSVFQIYLFLEPTRIRAVQAADRVAAEAAGRVLYAENCGNCHGDNGEGKIGRALNSRDLLKTATDETLFSLIRTGVPGTVMPAWGQTFGGPFTDQQVNQMVAFIRAWEPHAPEPVAAKNVPDPVRGATIFANTCSICHGEDGQGTKNAPALNDPARLKEFDDAWYRDTINHGRPAKGMPTWGTVLSPQQVNDLVALLAAWREGKTVAPAISLSKYLSDALFAIRQFDRLDAVFHLSSALTLANPAQAEEIKAALELIKANRLSEAEARLVVLLPPSEMGKELFASNCAPCHGDDGSGGLGKNLRGDKFIKSKSDAELVAFLLAGRKGTAMDGFKNILTEEQLGYLIALMRTWQK